MHWRDLYTTESDDEMDEEDDTALVKEQKSIWKHGGAIAIMMTDIEEIKSKQTLLLRGQKILTENLEKIGEDLKLLKSELHTGKKRMMKKTTCAVSCSSQTHPGKSYVYKHGICMHNAEHGERRLPLSGELFEY